MSRPDDGEVILAGYVQPLADTGDPTGRHDINLTPRELEKAHLPGSRPSRTRGPRGGEKPRHIWKVNRIPAERPQGESRSLPRKRGAYRHLVIVAVEDLARGPRASTLGRARRRVGKARERAQEEIKLSQLMRGRVQDGHRSGLA